MTDERRRSREAAVVSVATDPSGDPRSTAEPPRAPTAVDAPPRLAERGTATEGPPRLAGRATDVPPRLADRPPARDSVAAPYSFDDFPRRVVHSMHEAARAYRARVAEEIELRRVAILSAIRDERRADVLRAREEAVQRRRAVDMWALTAQRQIKSERNRRKVEVDTALRRTLREKNAEVNRRIRTVEAAIAVHRQRIEAYFDEIGKERDPIVIAERARGRPAFPTIDVARSAATTSKRPATDATTDRATYIQAELFKLDD